MTDPKAMSDPGRRNVSGGEDEGLDAGDSGGMGSTTGATANRHSAGPSGMGQSSGRGPDAVRDPDRVSGSGADAAPTSDADFGAGSGEPSGPGGSFTTSDPAMADQPVEGGEDEAAS